MCTCTLLASVQARTATLTLCHWASTPVERLADKCLAQEQSKHSFLSGGERGVFQPTPLCKIFWSAWLISLRDMLLKHIAFLPPPWKAYKPRFIICFTVRCSKRKDTCVCLCLKINTNILSAFAWCDMLVLDFVWFSQLSLLLWNCTLCLWFVL